METIVTKPKQMSFQTIEEYKEYIRKKAKEWRDEHKNDPEFKRREKKRMQDWRAKKKKEKADH